MKYVFVAEHRRHFSVQTICRCLCIHPCGFYAWLKESISKRAREDVFDYIEMFYNPKRKHGRNGMLSPIEFEQQQETRTEGV